MSKKQTSFRVGRVQGYLCGQVWYLCYHEHGRRRRPRVGPEREALLSASCTEVIVPRNESCSETTLSTGS